MKEMRKNKWLLKEGWYLQAQFNKLDFDRALKEAEDSEKAQFDSSTSDDFLQKYRDFIRDFDFEDVNKESLQKVFQC